MKAYLKLCEKFETTSRIYNAMAILGWDNSVMMPAGSAEDRARQQSTLGAIAHQITTAPEIDELLTQAEGEARDLDEWQKSNLRLMRNEWVHNNAVPEKLLTEMTMATSECEMIWRDAKRANDFKAFAVPLKKVLKLSREIAGLKAKALKLSLYDALLDQYDEGRRSADIDVIFAGLKNFLPDFIEQVKTRQSKGAQPKKPVGPFPIEKQKALAVKMMERMGFDFNKGRLDVSAHPFSGGTADDNRITTRYSEDDYTKAMMGVFHETGHALYSAGVPAKYRNQPVGNCLGMGIHESQSLLMEMQVCRSREFIKFIVPQVNEAFGSAPENSAENLYLYYNQVKPGLIRVDSDEVTYPIHVIIRYEIEKQLVAGTLEVDEIPELWNKMMKDMLGVTVPSDREGCLQDIHWSDGSFGYFPTYTLGAMTAAQLFAKCKKDNPNILKEIEQGNFNSLVSWLRANVHSQGCLYTADELIVKVTGEPLNSEVYKDYLKNKYLG